MRQNNENRKQKVVKNSRKKSILRVKNSTRPKRTQKKPDRYGKRLSASARDVFFKQALSNTDSDDGKSLLQLNFPVLFPFDSRFFLFISVATRARETDAVGRKRSTRRGFFTIPMNAKRTKKAISIGTNENSFRSLEDVPEYSQQEDDGIEVATVASAKESESNNEIDEVASTNTYTDSGNLIKVLHWLIDIKL